MPVILLALIVVPIVEIYVLVQVGQSIGVLPTIGLLIAMSLAGAWLIRREGARVWAAFTSAVGSGRVPTREVADGALVMFGGALLLTPGFLSDVFGLLCLLPPSRAVLRRALVSYVARRATRPRRGRSTLHVSSLRVDPTASRTGPVQGDVIEGELQD